jgi:lipopolysaccharide transport system ATP-binding protein
VSHNEVLVKVENVSKKFCRSLKRSLWYGMKDISSELFRRNSHPELRLEEFWALSDVSFELRRGECLGLIGRNGAGKSTLLKMLNGLIKPAEGRITMRGRVCALIELGAGFNPILTGRENVYVNAAVLGIPRQVVDKKLDSIVEFAEMEAFINTPVQYYSSGMKVRLGFAVAAQLQPDVMLIDEVLAVGDIGFRVKCISKIKELMQNSAVVFVTHTMQQVSNLCTKLIVLEKGKIEYHDNDVPGGIDHYLSKFSPMGSAVSGTGKAFVSDVKISNGTRTASGKERLLIEHGDDLSIEMDMTLKSPVRQLAILVWLEGRDQRIVADCFSHFCGFELYPHKRSKVKLTLRDLELNMGLYSVGISVSDLSTKESLSRNSGTAHVQVSTAYTSWSSFLLTGDWEQKEM